MTYSFWADKLDAARQPERTMPAPTLSQASAPADDDFADLDLTDPRNARTVETGSEVFSISGCTRSWETNSRKIVQAGILGPLGRKGLAAARAAHRHHPAQDNAALVQQLARDRAWDTPTGDLG
jgi:hypothetical protein